jgi:ABC-type maltose transport system permease subunit
MNILDLIPVYSVRDIMFNDPIMYVDKNKIDLIGDPYPTSRVLENSHDHEYNTEYFCECVLPIHTNGIAVIFLNENINEHLEDHMSRIIIKDNNNE